MTTRYCCKDFQKAADYDSFHYYRVEDDNYRAITKPGWYVRNAESNGPVASLKPFKHCPWCAKELKNEKLMHQ